MDPVSLLRIINETESNYLWPTVNVAMTMISLLCDLSLAGELIYQQHIHCNNTVL